MIWTSSKTYRNSVANGLNKFKDMQEQCGKWPEEVVSVLESRQNEKDALGID